MSDKQPATNIEPVSLDILALPESSASVLYSLYDVLSSVGKMWTLLTGEEESSAGFEVRIVSTQSATFFCHGNVPVFPHADIADCSDVEVIVVPDLFVEPNFHPDNNWQIAKQWLKRQYALGATICTVCTGSMLLADAGLLNGKEATTHWSAAEILRSRFPEVRLNSDKIFVSADEDQRLITTGGVSSWNELALYLIKHYCGYQEASRAIKIFLLGDRSDGQLPFTYLPRPKEHTDAVIEECQIWIAEHYDKPMPVQKMIELSNLTKRTFMRRFARATELNPIDYVQRLRIEEAKQLLETTQEVIEDISAKVGYEDPAYFRKIFKRKAGVSPAKYRTISGNKVSRRIRFLLNARMVFS